MSPGFIKGMFVTGIVFGCESILWSVYYWFRHNRAKAMPHLARGGFLTVLFALAYYLFTLGFFQDSSVIVVLLAFSTGSLVLEIFFKGGATKFFSQPMTAEIWQQRKITKRQFLLFGTLGMFIVAAEVAIVFTLVSPEVLALHWWFVLVLTISLAGLGFATWQWNAYEKKFGFDTTVSHQ